MKIKDCSVCKKLAELDKIIITQKLRSDTAVSDRNTQTTHAKDGEICFSFSLLRGIIMLMLSFVAIAGVIMAFKKCVEKKLLRKLEKDYFLVPVEEAERDNSSDD